MPACGRLSAGIGLGVDPRGLGEVTGRLGGAGSIGEFEECLAVLHVAGHLFEVRAVADDGVARAGDADVRVPGRVAQDRVPAAGTVYQLRVVLAGISPMVWRRLLVPAETSIAGLHEILQTAFGWSDEHLHRFTIHAVEYGLWRPGSAGFSRDARQVRLDSFGLRVGERFTYEYNFTAGWRHDIRVEEILPPRRAAAAPPALAAPGRRRQSTSAARRSSWRCCSAGRRR